MPMIEPTTVITAVVGALATSTGWSYFQRKVELKHDGTASLYGRIKDLEDRVEAGHLAQLQLVKEMAALHAETAALRTEVLFLREERKKLEKVVDELTDALKNAKSAAA